MSRKRPHHGNNRRGRGKVARKPKIFLTGTVKVYGTGSAVVETAEGTFQSEPLELKAGDELKCRQGASWDVNFPADNVVVEADGTYVVQLVVSGDSGEVTLIAQ